MNFELKIFSYLLLSIFSLLNINSQELIPLKLNNEWNYLEKEQINGIVAVKDTVKSRIEKIVTYNKKKWFYMNELGDKYIVRNDEKGQYELDTLNIGKNSNYREILMFKRNETNENLEYITYENLKVRVENKIYKIKTEAGIFECVKYSLTPQESELNEIIEFYIKPGIGLILHKWVENNKTTSYELINYNLN